MKKARSLLLLLGVVLITTGCSVTMSLAPYTPQNHIRAEGNAAIGQFLYQPYIDGKVQAANQVVNTAAGTIYAGMEIAELAKRGTALELEKSGFTLNENSKYMVCGNVLEFTIDDIGYSVDWKYSISYSIVEQQTQGVVFVDTFTPPMKTTGKFSDPSAYESILNNLIGQAYEMFIVSPGVKELLGQDES